MIQKGRTMEEIMQFGFYFPTRIERSVYRFCIFFVLISKRDRRNDSLYSGNHFKCLRVNRKNENLSIEAGICLWLYISINIFCLNQNISIIRLRIKRRMTTNCNLKLITYN